MRFPAVFIVPLAVVAGYFVSVPLFGHKYGTLADGNTTRILSQRDADECAARVRTRTKLSPSVAAEPHEQPPPADAPSRSLCTFEPLTSVSQDWLYLPRRFTRQRWDIQDGTSPLHFISNLFTSKSTWEVATGTALIILAVLPFSYLWELTSKVRRKLLL